MSGYSRQSAADIVPTAVVRSAPVNAEFNAIRDAFAFASGHKHDGSSTEGAYIPLIADVDANNKVSVNTTNNRIGVFVEAGGTSVEQVRFQDGAIVPVLTNDVDLGTSTAEFKNLYLDGTAKVDTLVVDESATISANLTVNSGTSTLSAVDINSGNIDNTVLGASVPAAATVTTLLATTATLTNADINAGTIDNTTVGATTASTVRGTTITATVGFSGDLTGNVTGNVTGNLTGNVTGDVVGNLTGNVAAATGSSSFNDVTINGTLNMNAGTTATITNLSAPVNAADAATKSYVDTSISALIDAAPGTLDTLNELAAALGDDPNFATTITNSIATKLSLAGGTMTGVIAMGANKITNLADPISAQDAATKVYVDTADALKLNLTGGTMTGNIVMGANKVTTTANPVSDDDLARKAYVDSILGSATAAATSAANAATSESNAATSETNAANSASSAATSAASASTSETNAATSASSAATSAANAATSESNAGNSAASAATSETNAANSASAAATSESNAATSETNAATSETNAAASESSAATSALSAANSFDSFDDRYLGAKSSAPSVDNDGDPLLTGALYWDTSTLDLHVWNGSSWSLAAANTDNVLLKTGGTVTGTFTVDASTPAAGDYFKVIMNDTTSVTMTANIIEFLRTDGGPAYFHNNGGGGIWITKPHAQEGLTIPDDFFTNGWDVEVDASGNLLFSYGSLFSAKTLQMRLSPTGDLDIAGSINTNVTF